MTRVYIEVSNASQSRFIFDIKKLFEDFTILETKVWEGRMINKFTPDYLQLKEWKSAVLVPLVLTKSGELSVLLTVRSNKISLYNNEVCLPGGKWDRTDESLVNTALREAYEEIGLKPENVTVIGEMPKFPTFRRKKRYSVYPVVGVIKETFYANLNKREVKDVFLIPLKNIIYKTLHDPDNDLLATIETGIMYKRSYFVNGVTYLMLAASAVLIFPPEHVQYYVDQLKLYANDSAYAKALLKSIQNRKIEKVAKL